MWQSQAGVRMGITDGPGMTTFAGLGLRLPVSPLFPAPSPFSMWFVCLQPVMDGAQT